MQENSQGIAFFTDNSGAITEVMYDEFEHCNKLVPGRLLPSIVDSQSRIKALNMLTELKSSGFIFDWQLNVMCQGPEEIHFTGMLLDDRLFFLAAKSKEDIVKLYQEMVQINESQANMLRLSEQNICRIRDVMGQDDHELFHRVTELNNELTRLQRELAQKNNELSRLNEQKNNFLGMAAHDLRNPLSVISTYTKFVLQEAGEDLSAEHTDFLNKVLHRADYMLGLVNELLDISVIESGKLSLDIRNTDVEQLLMDIVDSSRLLAKSKDMDIITQFDHHSTILRIDPGKIQQVMINLITNAIKYSNPGSAISVTAKQTANWYSISVADQGQGIPEDEIDKLFNLFQKASSRTTGGEASTGLGLAIANRILIEHKGRIVVESEVGKGSTFTIMLPNSKE